MKYYNSIKFSITLQLGIILTCLNATIVTSTTVKSPSSSFFDEQIIDQNFKITNIYKRETLNLIVDDPYYPSYIFTDNLTTTKYNNKGIFNNIQVPSNIPISLYCLSCEKKKNIIIRDDNVNSFPQPYAYMKFNKTEYMTVLQSKFHINSDDYRCAVVLSTFPKGLNQGEKIWANCGSGDGGSSNYSTIKNDNDTNTTNIKNNNNNNNKNSAFVIVEALNNPSVFEKRLIRFIPKKTKHLACFDRTLDETNYDKSDSSSNDNKNNIVYNKNDYIISWGRISRYDQRSKKIILQDITENNIDYIINNNGSERLLNYTILPIIENGLYLSVSNQVIVKDLMEYAFGVEVICFKYRHKYPNNVTVIIWKNCPSDPNIISLPVPANSNYYYPRIKYSLIKTPFFIKYFWESLDNNKKNNNDILQFVFNDLFSYSDITIMLIVTTVMCILLLVYIIYILFNRNKSSKFATKNNDDNNVKSAKIDFNNTLSNMHVNSTF
uniref:Uncharacterized protein n=1 Tax=Metapenaeus joyneri majanivirus TaxID=2984280 RepID=A0A9C7BZP6_9VIRU|nr:MAG: hypothetical protein [Metapenaeus joyneri majanivirus]